MLINNLYKISPLIKSSFDAGLVLIIGLLLGGEITGVFLAKYYWLYLFTFISGGLTTLVSLTKNINPIDRLSIEHTNVVFLVFLVIFCSIIFCFYDSSVDLPAFLILLLASLLGIVNTRYYVKLESTGYTKDIFILSIFSRLLFILVVLSLYFFILLNSILLLALGYLVKEISEVFFHKKKVIQDLNFFFIFKKHKKYQFHLKFFELLNVISSAGVDVLVRLTILLFLGGGDVYRYEYLNRFPKIISSVAMQLTRHQIFEKNFEERSFFSRFGRLTLIPSTLLGYFLVIQQQAFGISGHYLDVIVICLCGMNLFFVVPIYNNLLRAKKLNLITISILINIPVAFLWFIFFGIGNNSCYFITLINVFLTCSTLIFGPSFYKNIFLKVNNQ